MTFGASHVVPPPPPPPVCAQPLAVCDQASPLLLVPMEAVTETHCPGETEIDRVVAPVLQLYATCVDSPQNDQPDREECQSLLI